MSNPPEIWVKVCRELEKVITPDALHRWFSSIVPISYEAGRLVLGVENAIYQYWIEENYLNQLRECATLAVGREVKISFDVVGSKDRPTPSLRGDERRERCRGLRRQRVAPGPQLGPVRRPAACRTAAPCQQVRYPRKRGFLPCSSWR